MSAETIEKGDHVFIGSGKVIWDVIYIATDGFAYMRSGMTGLLRAEPLSKLRLHSKRASHDHSDPR